MESHGAHFHSHAESGLGSGFVFGADLSASFFVFAFFFLLTFLAFLMFRRLALRTQPRSPRVRLPSSVPAQGSWNSGTRGSPRPAKFLTKILPLFCSFLLFGLTLFVPHIEALACAGPGEGIGHGLPLCCVLSQASGDAKNQASSPTFVSLPLDENPVPESSKRVGQKNPPIRAPPSRA